MYLWHVKNQQRRAVIISRCLICCFFCQPFLKRSAQVKLGSFPSKFGQQIQKTLWNHNLYIVMLIYGGIYGFPVLIYAHLCSILTPPPHRSCCFTTPPNRPRCCSNAAESMVDTEDKGTSQATSREATFNTLTAFNDNGWLLMVTMDL